MKILRATPKTVVVEMNVHEVMNAEAALLTFHRDQQNMQTPFGIRIQDEARDFRHAQDAMWAQDARARGLTVEGDDPIDQGAF